MLVSDIVAENLPFWLRASKILQAACVGGAISETNYLAGLNEAGMGQSRIIGRQHFDASQIAEVVLEMMPAFVSKIKCCGNSVMASLIAKVANPITQKLWSARIYAVKPAS